jgi:hypothetical protein
VRSSIWLFVKKTLFLLSSLFRKSGFSVEVRVLFSKIGLDFCVLDLLKGTNSVFDTIKVTKVEVSWLYERAVFDKESVSVDTLIPKVLTIRVLIELLSIALVKVSWVDKRLEFYEEFVFIDTFVSLLIIW